MSNSLYFRNKGLCKTCIRGHCVIEDFPCGKCYASFSECPCNAKVENEEFCKFYEMDFPKGEIFESIKRGFKAYLIGKYGTKKEKHDYELNLNYADDNMDIASPPKPYEIEGILKHMLCKIMYEMGDFENEN